MTAAMTRAHEIRSINSFDATEWCQLLFVHAIDNVQDSLSLLCSYCNDISLVIKSYRFFSRLACPCTEYWNATNSMHPRRMTHPTCALQSDDQINF